MENYEKYCYQKGLPEIGHLRIDYKNLAGVSVVWFCPWIEKQKKKAFSKEEMKSWELASKMRYI